MMSSPIPTPLQSDWETRLEAIRQRLDAAERRKAAVDARQDFIDDLAFRTIAAISALQGKVETLKLVCEGREEVRRRRVVAYLEDNNEEEADTDVSETLSSVDFNAQ